MQKVISHLLFLSFLLLCTACSSEKTIVNALDEKEANEIVVFLAQRGITANKVKAAEAGGGGGGAKVAMFDITVSEDQATEAMALLNQNGLPRRRGQNLLGLFSNVGLVPSEMQDKIRYQAGLAEQIANTIRKIDGVLDAEVQISFPEENPLNPMAEKKQKITASVYVKHNGVLDDPNAHLVTKIKRLVSSSIVGLDFDNVTVIGDRARYNEQPAGAIVPGQEEEKQYVNVWSLILAQESIFRFRLIFFSFTILILLLLLAFIWVSWKLYPLLKQHGGVKEIFHLHPIGAPPKKAEEKEAGKEEAKGEKKEEKGAPKAPGKEPAKEAGKEEPKKGAGPEQGLVDEDIDET